MARIFKKVLKSGYLGCFKTIIFAILDDESAVRKDNEQGNFQPFFKLLHKMRIGKVVENSDKENTVFFKSVDENGFLSPYFPCEISWKSLKWTCAQHLFYVFFL
jgi:hypothetical protein